MSHPCGFIIARSPTLIRHFCRRACCASCAHDGAERRLGRFLTRACLPLDPDSEVTAVAIKGVHHFPVWRRALHQSACYLRGSPEARWKAFGLIGVWTGDEVIGIIIGGRTSILLEKSDWRIDRMPLGEIGARMAQPSGLTLPLRSVWVTVSSRDSDENESEIRSRKK